MPKIQPAKCKNLEIRSGERFESWKAPDQGAFHMTSRRASMATRYRKK